MYNTWPISLRTLVPRTAWRQEAFLSLSYHPWPCDIHSVRGFLTLPIFFERNALPFFVVGGQCRCGIAVLVLLGYLSKRYDVVWDWTVGKRNTLTQASQKQLQSMDSPIKFIAFAYPGADERASVDFFVGRYQRVKPDIEVEFVDPASQPAKVREYKISTPGEVVLEYQGRRENLRGLSEQEITTALQRLSYTGDSWIDLPGVSIALLDTAVPGGATGSLTSAQLGGTAPAPDVLPQNSELRKSTAPRNCFHCTFTSVAP